jgi:MFS family permease
MSAGPARSPSHWQRGFILQLIVTALSATAMHATKPTVTYRALSLGATPLEIGLIQSAFSIVPALTAVAIGRWIDKAGESRFLMLSLGSLAAGAVIAAFAPGLLVLGLAQVALGFGQIIYLVASQAMIANHGREGREVRFGHYSTVTSIGQLAGPAIAAAILGASVGAAIVAGPSMLASTGSLAAPILASAADLASENREAGAFLVAALLTFTACGIAFFIPSAPRRSRADASGAEAEQPGIIAMTRQVLRRDGMVAAMYVSIVAISAVDVLIAYMPAYGEDVGLSIVFVGTLLSIRAGASLVSRFFMARLIDALGRSKLLAASMLLAGGGLLVMPFEASPPVLVAIMVVVGLGLGLGQPMTIAWVANRSPRSERATALGVRITGNRVALLVVPTAMGAIAGSAGITAIFVVIAISLVVGAAVAMTTSFDDDSMDPTAIAPAGATTVEPALPVTAEPAA